MKLFLFLVMGLIFLFAACFEIKADNSKDKKPDWQTISAKEAFNMMEVSENYILLDVRTESEFQERRIKGAILIPDNEIKERAGAELPDKKAVIFVYCRSGRRSASAAAELAKLGYTNVYDFGGILSWPYETVGGL